MVQIIMKLFRLFVKRQQNTLRLMLTLAGMNGWLVHQLDVKTAFLNGDLNEEVFVKPPF